MSSGCDPMPLQAESLPTHRHVRNIPLQGPHIQVSLHQKTCMTLVSLIPWQCLCLAQRVKNVMLYSQVRSQALLDLALSLSSQWQREAPHQSCTLEPLWRTPWFFNDQSDLCCLGLRRLLHMHKALQQEKSAIAALKIAQLLRLRTCKNSASQQTHSQRRGVDIGQYV